MKRFISVGLGTFGSYVAATLADLGHEVIAIDVDEQRIDTVGPRVTRAVVGDGRDKEILRQIGAENADVAVVSTGDDMSASILAVMALQDLNVGEIYVKVISQDHARIMRKMGVNETVLPERDTAVDLGTRIARGGALRKYIHLGEEFSLQEMNVPQEWIGKTLRKLDLHRQYRVTIIARHDIKNDEIDSPPDPDTPLEKTDTLLVAGRDDKLQQVASVAYAS